MFSRLTIIATLLLLLGSAKPATADDFTIVSVEPPTDTIANEARVVIAGGYFWGVEKGATGSVYTTEKEDTILIGKAEVVDVSICESFCLFKKTAERDVAVGDKLHLTIPEKNISTFIAKGREAYEAGDLERAFYFLATTRHDFTSEDSLELMPLIAKSRPELEKEYADKLSLKEEKPKKGMGPVCLKVAQFHLTELSLSPAEYYFKEYRRIVKGDKFAKEMLKRIKEYREFKPDKIVAKALDLAKPEELETGEIFPKTMKQVKPDYPKEARSKRLQGVVWVKALVAKTGKVFRALVHESSGYPILDDAAVAAAYENEYIPGVQYQDSRPVNCWVCYKVNFKL